MAGLAALPLDLLSDTLLPLLSPASLAALACASRAFHALITGPDGEHVWRRKCELDFHFPSSNTGRRHGWMTLYRRLERQDVWVWGEHANGRMGIALYDARYRTKLIQGGFPLPMRIKLPAPVVGLEAGGWSFHALTTRGEVLVWGTMDGTTHGRTWTSPGFELHVPTRLPVEGYGDVVQMSAGRSHVVLKNSSNEIWEYRSFGRVYKVVDPSRAWNTSPSNRIVAVEAGWSHSLALTASGDVFIWWEPGSQALTEAANVAGEASVPESVGVAFSLEFDTIKLPSLPGARDGEKIACFASGDNFVIALSSSALLYFLDVSPVLPPNVRNGRVGATDPLDSPTMSRSSRAALDTAFLSGQRSWRLMQKFVDACPQLTSVSAHFRSFAAYAIPLAQGDEAASRVLLGTAGWTEATEPDIVPELQGKGVIKVAQGDYHQIALTNQGHLYSWGKFSCGALGLGHPQLLKTPLSAPHPPPRPDPSVFASPPAPAPYPMPQIPQQQRGIFPGFTRGAPAAPIPQPPEVVEHPTLIQFPGDAAGERDADSEKGKFVFHVTASGWHSGALAVELSRDAVAEDEAIEPVETVIPPELEEGAGRGQHPLWRGGSFPFRLGYPARGMMRRPAPADPDR